MTGEREGREGKTDREREGREKERRESERVGKRDLRELLPCFKRLSCPEQIGR